ncbi:kinesin family protein, partial [Aureobasidium melanogenum]
MALGGGGNIKVVVRVRPFNSREIDRKAQCIVQMKGEQTVLSPPTNIDPRSKNAKAAIEGSKTFAFDKSYWSFNKKDASYAGQDNLFDDLGKPLLDNAFGGYNNCIFAYGQTGSGKSYSMMGYGPEEGVIPKICRAMFERIDEAQKDNNLTCTVEVSYLEIYNERVRDLLNPSTKGNLKVREHPSTGPYVEDLAKLVVRSFAEIEHLMDEGNKARTVAATNMNETSSRSHAVFTLTLSQKRHDADTGMDTEKAAKISLVDLAGSERAQSTGATGARLKEGAEINRSLSTLGRVIAALADLSSAKPGVKKKNASMVPYRDSVLTWLLKDSLGGNSMTAMIAAISPADINFEETLSTLRYADSAKRIKNHAVVNEDANARMIRELKEELAQLRSKLTTGGGAGEAGAIASEQYPPDTPLEKQMVSITQADGTVKQVSKAEIVEQLDQSEKLYQDLNQTWEQKLQKTELIHKEREAALEELGISIEKGFVGLSTPKKMPHLVNLSDDPLLAECLVYNLKPGTTTVGNVETAKTAEIRLNGSKILHEHCTFENEDDVVTVVPRDNAAVMVNGQRVDQPKRLRSGYRIILGDFHIFRFNHPQEARAERAEEGSRLKHSITADEIGDPSSPSPSVSHGHDRSWSNVSRLNPDYDLDSRANSPMPMRSLSGRENDYDLARREAVSSMLGSDQKISALTDDELDNLFDDLQKVRAVRRGRPESRLFDLNEDDSDSVSSFPVREKYLSNGTLENFSLDTALTMPSTPRDDDEDETLRAAKEGLQTELERQKEEYRAQIQSAQEMNVEVETIRAEKIKMEENLKAVKEDMEKRLQAQKDEYDRQLKELRDTTAQPVDRKTGLTEKQLHLVKSCTQHWRQQRYVAMAAALLQNAAILKEAQVMSQQMDKNVVFQFTVADAGHTYGSSYDLVLSDISADDDMALHTSRKPCTAVRVIDFKHNVVHLWSLQKLRARVRLMRQVFQYMDRPEYIKHFRLDNPFSESCLPQYTRIGDADISLAAVFECRVQDFTLDVYSPYTNTMVGIVRLSLEPSSAEAPSSTLKFNVVMHDFVGFSEQEGTEVHAQLFFPGISEEDGASTTQMVSDFDEGPVRFDSVHSMSLPLASPRDSCLRVSVFARVTGTHLDKLLSWDDMRDSAVRPQLKRNNSRIAEHEYYNEEGHDVFARIQVLEIGEDGSYKPVEVLQKNIMDPGTYQLHQGLQRRITLDLTHTSGNILPLQEVTSLRVGNVHLVDPSGKVPDLSSQQNDVILTPVSPPIIRTNPDGTTNIHITTHWDSSSHESLLLDRPTAEGYCVKLSFAWIMASPKLAEPIEFVTDLAVQMRGRSFMRQTSLFSSLFSSSRIVRSTSGTFSVTVKPIPSKRAGDLWRLSTSNTYVKGEEMLQGWSPRGVSLIHDFIDSRSSKRKMAEIDAARGILSSHSLSLDTMPLSTSDKVSGERQDQLLRKILTLWKADPAIGKRILTEENTDSPRKGVAFASSINGTGIPLSLATVHFVPKNPSLLKAGYLLTPDPAAREPSRWVRRYVELRQPYMHIHSATATEHEEIGAINLNSSRVDAAPQIAKLLRREGGAPTAVGRHGVPAVAAPENVFAVYGNTKAWVFAARTERDKGEWIFAIDRSYIGTEEFEDDEDEDDGY